MRLKAILAGLVVAVAATQTAAVPAEAGGLLARSHADVEDRYAYRYEPRGYYPYYNSGYWRPAHEVRRRRVLVQPPYYQAWGDNRRDYHHRSWHKQHHGRHRLGHW